MSSPEQGGKSPREPEPRESYYRAASFFDADIAGLVYQQAEALIFSTPCDLSTFRLHLNQMWFVVVLGSRPPAELDHLIESTLMVGEPTVLPTSVLSYLFARRAQALTNERRIPPLRSATDLDW